MYNTWGCLNSKVGQALPHCLQSTYGQPDRQKGVEILDPFPSVALGGGSALVGAVGFITIRERAAATSGSPYINTALVCMHCAIPYVCNAWPPPIKCCHGQNGYFLLGGGAQPHSIAQQVQFDPPKVVTQH